MVLANVNALFQAGRVIEKGRLACKGKRQKETRQHTYGKAFAHHAGKTHQRLVPQLLL
jgi:hypothetical protein